MSLPDWFAGWCNFVGGRPLAIAEITGRRTLHHVVVSSLMQEKMLDTYGTTWYQAVLNNCEHTSGYTETVCRLRCGPTGQWAVGTLGGNKGRNNNKPMKGHYNRWSRAMSGPARCDQRRPRKSGPTSNDFASLVRFRKEH